MSDETTNNEADAPIAEGLDGWWKSAGNNADAAEQEKRAIEAQDFQQHRAFRYVMSEGREDCGGWLGSSASGRAIHWQRGRQNDWR
jgi:hypothetical protein